MPMTRSSRAITAAVLGSILIASSCGGNDPAVTTAPTTAALPTQSETTETTAEGGDPCGSWAKTVYGQPSAMAGPTETGFFVWYDFTGWHVRVRGEAAKGAVFSGRITGDRDLSLITPISDPDIEAPTVGNRIDFKIKAGSELKGFDIDASCPTMQLRIELLVDGKPAPTEKAFVGYDSKALDSTFITARETP